jgi:plasmid maintenance system killer protein
LEILYSSKTVKEQCTDIRRAKRLFGGDKKLAVKLLARINALEQATCLKDISIQPQYRFHKLGNKNGRNLEGFFAIDVKSISDPWRILLRPLDENKEPFVPCNIDEIASIVEIVEIAKVSKHYE